MFVLEKDDLSFSAVTHSSKESNLNEQMNGFIKKTQKHKFLVEKIQAEFKISLFFESFSGTEFGSYTRDHQYCLFAIETAIKAVEISPASLVRVPIELLSEAVTQMDGCGRPEDSVSCQLFFEHISRFFELLVAQDSQCRVFKQLLGEMVGKVFEESFQSVNFILVFTKVLSHIHKSNVN